jgi:hypothetical protein
MKRSLPIMAPLRHSGAVWRCPFLGVDRKWRFGAVRAGFDPFRTSRILRMHFRRVRFRAFRCNSLLAS